jgi:hypothetical protein
MSRNRRAHGTRADDDRFVDVIFHRFSLLGKLGNGKLGIGKLVS